LRLRYRAINADGNASRSARRQRPPRWRQSRSTVEQRQMSAAVARGPTTRCFMSVRSSSCLPVLIKRFRTCVVHSSAEASSTAIC